MKSIEFIESKLIGLKENGSYVDVELYKKSISEGIMSYCQFSGEPSPHSIGDQVRDVFHEDLSKEIQKAMLPFIKIDLSAINKAYDVCIPTFYYENTHFDWVLSKIDASGKVEDMVFCDDEGKTYAIEELMQVYKDKRTYDGKTYYFEEYDEILEALNSFTEEHYHIVLDENIPKETKLDTINAYYEYRSEWRSRRGSITSSRYISETDVGPYPYPIQNNFNLKAEKSPSS